MTTLTIPRCGAAKQWGIMSALRDWHASQPDFDELVIVEWGDTLRCSSTGPVYDSMLAAIQGLVHQA